MKRPTLLATHARTSEPETCAPPVPPPQYAKLEAMLSAIVRMVGANDGTVRAIGQNGSRFEPGVAVGLGFRLVNDDGAYRSQCSACTESRRAESVCVRSGLCGHLGNIPADALGNVCKHMVAVPLRHEDCQVGALHLWFDAESSPPPAMMRLLRAAGELFGMALDNTRLAREDLRASLTHERQMMANEVHDSLAQGLTYMRMRMSLLRHAIAHGDESGAIKYWSDVDSALTNAHRRLREFITYFRSRMDPQGLQHALAESAATFYNRTGVTLAFDNAAPDLELPVGREVEVFHIVQEALANVSHHASARNARLALARTAAGYEIVVEDDGIGMPADSGSAEQGESGHYGIAIMRERALRMGGELLIESAPNAGTRVRFRFPAPQSQSDQRR